MKNLLALVLLLLSTLPASADPLPSTRPAEPLRFAIDVASPGKPITNKFSDLNMWAIDNVWLQEAPRTPDDYFRRHYPFVEHIQLMAATGGNAKRDLFKNPAGPAALADYDFTPLTTACRNILAKGLKPMIKTGWVPLKLSDQPEISKAFGTNLRPPRDFDAYYAYIRAMALHLRRQFGLREVQSWSWGVGVEFDNRDWFLAADGNPDTTRRAFFKLYDYTVAALEDALGSDPLTVGAHAMATHPGFWDPALFLEHCARDPNAKTGRMGTRLNFFGLSFYTIVPGFQPAKLQATLEKLRAKAADLGLKNLRFGVDEGRVLNGWDDRVLFPREVQHPIQSAGDAKLFCFMVERDLDYFSTWNITSNGLFGGLPLTSSHLRNLAFRMVGSQTLAVQTAGQPADPADDVALLAAYNPAQKTLRILLYNFNLDRNARSAEPLTLRLDHLQFAATAGSQPAAGGPAVAASALTVRTWRLDADHANWWNLWQADVAARKMGPPNFRTSIWSPALPSTLAKPADRDFFNSRQPAYAQANALTPTESKLPVPAPPAPLQLQLTLPPQGVTLLEITPVEPTAPPAR